MPDSAHNAEIEDVLSSIRRLVAGESAGRAKPSDRRSHGPSQAVPSRTHAEEATAIEQDGTQPPDSGEARAEQTAEAEPALVLKAEDRVAEPERPLPDVEELRSQWDADADADKAAMPGVADELEASEEEIPEPAPPTKPDSDNSRVVSSSKRMPLLAQTLLQNRPIPPESPSTSDKNLSSDPRNSDGVDDIDADVAEAPFDDRREEDLPPDGGDPVPMFRRAAETWKSEKASAEPATSVGAETHELDSEPLGESPAVPVEGHDAPEMNVDAWEDEDDCLEDAVEEPKELPTAPRRSGFAFGAGLPPAPVEHSGVSTAPSAMRSASGGRPLWATRHQHVEAPPPVLKEGAIPSEMIDRSASSTSEKTTSHCDAIDPPEVSRDVHADASPTQDTVRQEPHEPEVLDIFADDESQDEDEEIRALISRVVIEELQGPLGERITRNVRKLVRREIQRALAARNFD